MLSINRVETAFSNFYQKVVKSCPRRNFTLALKLIALCVGLFKRQKTFIFTSILARRAHDDAFKECCTYTTAQHGRRIR